MNNPIDGIIPDFTIFGVEFTNIWQKLFAGLWGLAIIAAIVYLIMGLFKLGANGETNPQAVAEAKKQIIRSSVSLGGLVALCDEVYRLGLHPYIAFAQIAEPW